MLALCNTSKCSLYILNLCSRHNKIRHCSSSHLSVSSNVNDKAHTYRIAASPAYWALVLLMEEAQARRAPEADMVIARCHSVNLLILIADRTGSIHRLHGLKLRCPSGGSHLTQTRSRLEVQIIYLMRGKQIG